MQALVKPAVGASRTLVARDQRSTLDIDVQPGPMGIVKLHTQHWKGAWIGFDFLLLLSFAATGWAFWRGRQIVIACLIVTGTLLCCDAWFDVVLDAGSSDVWVSVASALVVELPLALFMFNAARRLIRLSALVAVSESGDPGDPEDLGELRGDGLPPLWKIPLFGVRPAAQDSGSR